MTQALNIGQPVQLVREALSWVALRRRAVERAALLWRAAATGLLVVLALALLDALWPMAAGVRLILSLAFYAAAAWVLVRCARLRRADAGHDWREARRLEHTLHLAANPLLNALGLAPLAAGRGKSLPEELSRRAVISGCQAAAEIDLHAAVDHRPLRRALGHLGLVMLLAAAALALQPRFFAGGAARLFDPLGDHPPFSLTRFDVAASPPDPLTGQDVIIQARLSGKLPPHADLVELDSRGRPARRWPMNAGAAAPGQALFERRLQAVREPLVIRVEAQTGYSHQLAIVPRAPKPAPKKPDAGPPDQGNDPQPPDHLTISTTHPAGSGNEAAAGDAAALRAALARLAAMADAARRIQAISAELAARLQALGDSGALPDWLKEQLKLLQQRMDNQTASGRTLAQQMDDMASAAAASGVDPSLVRFLKLAAKNLAALGLPQQPGLGMSGGGAGMSPRQLAELLAKLAEAAGQDARALEQQLANLDAAAGGSSTGAGTGGQVVTTQPSGAAIEIALHSGGNLSAAEALSQSAPPLYRDLVRRYYERLIRDQQRD